MVQPRLQLNFLGNPKYLSCFIRYFQDETLLAKGNSLSSQILMNSFRKNFKSMSTMTANCITLRSWFWQLKLFDLGSIIFVHSVQYRKTSNGNALKSRKHAQASS